VIAIFIAIAKHSNFVDGYFELANGKYNSTVGNYFKTRIIRKVHMGKHLLEF